MVMAFRYNVFIASRQRISRGYQLFRRDQKDPCCAFISGYGFHNQLFFKHKTAPLKNVVFVSLVFIPLNRIDFKLFWGYVKLHITNTTW